MQNYYKTEYDSQMSTYAVKVINYLMAKAWNETTARKDGRKRVLTGRMPAKPKSEPERNKEGDIDWYRFVFKILEPFFLPNYDDLRRQKLGLILMLNGVTAHISSNCSPFYEGWEINRLD